MDEGMCYLDCEKKARKLIRTAEDLAIYQRGEWPEVEAEEVAACRRARLIAEAEDQREQMEQDTAPVPKASEPGSARHL